jgi:long-chain acyl-CoA synthetase
MGIRAGDCIGIALRNGPQFFELLGAATAMGAKAVLVAWRLKRDEVEYIVKDSCDKVVIFDEESAPSVAGLPSLGLDEYERRLLVALPAEDLPRTLTGFAFDLYSSGTTGRPKAIERERSAPAFAAPAQMSRPTFLEMMGIDAPGEVHLVCGPLYHSQPIGFSGMALSAGHRVVLMEGSFDAEACLRAIDVERITWMTCVPTHLIRILGLPAEVRNRYDMSSIKAILHSAAPCPRDIKARAMDFVPANSMWEIYGGTEGAMTMISPQEAIQKPGSVGQAFPPGTELQILDTEGQRMPNGQVGMVFARAPTPFRYRGAPELDAQTWRGDFFTLGDGVPRCRRLSVHH